MGCREESWRLVKVPIRATERSSLVDRVIEQLRSLIESGEWAVGAKIPAEPVLTEMLQVGRNTVREAVRALGYSGLLEPRQGDGTYVRASDALGAALQRRLRRGELMETLEVRSSLERDAVRLAAARRDDGDIAAIRGALRERDAAWDNADTDAAVRADVAFHQAVVAAAHNGVLADLYSSLTNALSATVASVMEAPPPTGPDPDTHHALADAIAAGDPNAAAICVSRYIDEAAASVRTLLDTPPMPHHGGVAKR